MQKHHKVLPNVLIPRTCLGLLEVKLVGVWVPDLCFPHLCNHRSLLKDPPIDGKGLNARLPGAEEGL